MKINQYRVFLVLILVIFTGIIVIMYQNTGTKPQESFIEAGDKVEIAVICPQSSELEAYTFLAEMAEQDINDYMVEQGFPLEFVFNVSNADGRAMNAYNLAKQHYENGNRLIVGLSWSSQMDTFFSFANSNDCLIISPGSTQTWPWRLAPNTYRLYPAEHLYTVPLTRCVESLNISKVVIVKLRFSFADIMYDEFKDDYSGEVSEIVIESDSTDVDFNSTTQLLEAEIKESIQEHGIDHVAVYFISLSDHLAKILDSSTDDTLYSVPWFVWNWYTWHQDPGTRFSDFEEDKTQLARIQLIGAHPAIPDNPTYTRVNEAYQEAFDQLISMIHGNIYDGLWITALAVAETGSVNGTKVGLAIPDIAKSYVGVTGNCSLNDWGDRWGVDWTIYGYRLIEDQSTVTEFGFYNCTTGEITWYDR